MERARNFMYFDLTKKVRLEVVSFSRKTTFLDCFVSKEDYLIGTSYLRKKNIFSKG